MSKKVILTKNKYYAGLGLYILLLGKVEEMQNLENELKHVLRDSPLKNYADWIGDYIWCPTDNIPVKDFSSLLDKLELDF